MSLEKRLSNIPEVKFATFSIADEQANIFIELRTALERKNL